MQKVCITMMCVYKILNNFIDVDYLIKTRQQRWWRNHLLNRSFSIASETDFFRIKHSQFSGTAGDAMSKHNLNNRPFTTVDRDNDG